VTPSDRDIAEATRWLDALGENRWLPSIVQRVDNDAPASGWECGVYHGATLGECIVTAARALGWQPSPPPERTYSRAEVLSAMERVRFACNREGCDMLHEPDLASLLDEPERGGGRHE